MALAMLTCQGVHALIRESFTKPERPHALQAAVVLEGHTLMAADYRRQVDGASGQIMQSFTRESRAGDTVQGSLLMQYYTNQWEKAHESPPAFFIALDFNVIVEGYAREGKMGPLGMFLDLWAQLDWSRKHFMVLQQCSPEQLEHYAQKLKPEFQLLHPNLTVFDSRLTNLKLATRHPALQSWQLRRVGSQSAAGWAAKHIVPIPVFHGDDPHGKNLSLLRNCSGSVKDGAYFAGSIKHGPRPADEKEPIPLSARKAIYAVVTNDEVLRRRVKVDAYRVNDTVGQVPFSKFAENLCAASFALVGSGTFTPSFMTAEAIHAGTLPIFVVGNGTCCRPEGLPMARAATRSSSTLVAGATPHMSSTLVAEVRSDYDDLLPFYDEGVRFSRFGEIVPVGTLTAPLLRQLLDSKKEYLVAKRQALKDVAPRFTPEGTWQYILRRMRVPGALAEPLPDASHNPPADFLAVRESQTGLKVRPGEPQPDSDSDAGTPRAVQDMGVSTAIASVWHDIATGRKVDEREDEKFRSGDLDSETPEPDGVRPATAAERPATPSDADEDAAPDGWHYMLNEFLPREAMAPSPAELEIIKAAEGDLKLLGSACTSCGVNAAHKSGAPNCCSEGGSWEGMCDEGGEHTWHEGFQACPASRASRLGITSEAFRRLRASSQAQETKADAETR